MKFIKCDRCGKEHPWKNNNPKGWTTTEIGHHFCDKCSEEYERVYERFININTTKENKK